MAVQQAYQRKPGFCYGILCENDAFNPLTLVGCTVDAEVQESLARVIFKVEYCNQTRATQKTFAAFTVPKGWTLLSVAAESSTQGDYHQISSKVHPCEGSKAQEYNQFRIHEGVDQKGGIHRSSFFDHNEGHCHQNPNDGRVATLAIPWPIMVDHCVVAEVIFLAPLGGTGHYLVIPKILFPYFSPSEDADFVQLFKVGSHMKLAASKTGKCGIKVLHIYGKTVAFNVAPPAVEGGNESVSSTLTNDRDSRWFDVNFEDKLTTSRDYVIRFAVQPLQDFLTLTLAREDQSNGINDADMYALTIAVNPMFSPAQMANANAEFIFIAGLGNGISPKAFKCVKKALLLSINGLPESCNVNIVNCTSNDPRGDSWLFPVGSQPVSADFLTPGSVLYSYVERKMLPFSHITSVSPYNNDVVPMRRPVQLVQEIISSVPFIQGLARNIIFLTTDGGSKLGVTLLQTLEGNRHSTSVSALALNMCDTCDLEYLEAMCKASGGLFAVSQETEHISDKLASLLDDLVVPTLTNVSCNIVATNVNGSEVDCGIPEGGALPQAPIRMCSCDNRSMPFIRCNHQKFTLLHAFVDRSVKNFTVTLDGLVGNENMRYIAKSDPDLSKSPSCSINNHTIGDSLSLSLPHLVCATTRIQYLLLHSTPQSITEASRLAASFEIFCYLTSFECRNDKKRVIPKALLAYETHPIKKHTSGRGRALMPREQSRAVSVTFRTLSPFMNVAENEFMCKGLAREEDVRVNDLRRLKLQEMQKRIILETAKGVDGEDDEIINNRNTEKYMIKLIKNDLPDVLGSKMKPISTYEFFRNVIDDIINRVLQVYSIDNLILSQEIDGCFLPSNPVTITALGLSLTNLETSIPNKLLEKVREVGVGNNALSRSLEVMDLWVTALCVSRLAPHPKASLAVRKAMNFLAAAMPVGVDPEQLRGQSDAFLQTWGTVC